MKQRSKAIATSIATIAMCASLAVGGTFALFTSESEVNVAVTSGTVSVLATTDEPQLSSTFGNLPETKATVDNNTITISNMVPGDTIKFNITVDNQSTVTVEYRTLIKCLEDNGLFKGLKVTVGDVTFNGTTAVSQWDSMTPDAENIVIPVTITLPEESGLTFGAENKNNQYQGKTCKISYRVEAVQGNANPEDSFVQEDNGDCVIYDALGLTIANDMMAKNYGEGRGITFRLANNIDMKDYAWDCYDTSAWFVFDGAGYTVSNLTCGMSDLGRSGFIGSSTGVKVQNLTLENVTVAGTQAGVIFGHSHGGSIIDCTVKGTNSVSYQKSTGTYQESHNGLGAVLGADGATTLMDNISVESGTTIHYNGMITQFSQEDNAGFYMSRNSENSVTGLDTVAEDGEWYKYVADGVALDLYGGYHIFNANGLGYFSAKALTGNNVVTEEATISLLNDIDMQGANFSAIIAQRGDTLNFNGNGYTISNVNVVSGAEDNTTGQAGLFYCYPNSTLNVSNLTVAGATVQSEKNGSGYAAVIVGYNEGATTLTNVDVIDAKVYGVKSSGSLVGHLSGSLTATDCDVTSSSVTLVEFAEEADGHYAGKVLGTLAGPATLTNCKFDVTLSGRLKADNIGDVYGRKTAAGSLTQDGYTNLPTAKVEELDVKFFNDMFAEDNNLKDLGIEVDFGMDFEATQTSADIQNEEYKDYMVDFEITFSEDVFVGNVILMGYYENFGAAAIVALSVADEHGIVKAGTYRVMDELFGLETNYEFIVDYVNKFKCGVIMCDVDYDANVEGIENAKGEQITNTPGTKFVAPEDLVITLELVMYQDNSYTNGIKIGDTITYTYDGKSPTVNYSVMCEILSSQF